jgi:hypothetical protein
MLLFEIILIRPASAALRRVFGVGLFRVKMRGLESLFLGGSQTLVF